MLKPFVANDTNVWVSKLVEGQALKTWISNVFVVTLDIGVHTPLSGSVERG